MRNRSDAPRLAAAVIVLSIAATGGTAFLTGCGSGGSTVSTPTSSGSNNFTGRSYVSNGISLGSFGQGNVTVNVSSSGQITATITFLDPTARAVRGTANLTGTLNQLTGVFNLSGTYTPAGGSAVPLTISGVFPTPPATTGGSLTVTLGSQTVTATFGSGSASGTPTPSPTPTGSGSPTPTPNPSVTPTPTPTPRVTPTPTPAVTPTPTPTPSTGTGTLADYYTAFQSSTNDVFTYKFTNTTAFNPDPNNQSGTTTNQFTFHGGGYLGSGAVGNKTQVTITLPKSGNVTVTRQEELNPANNSVIGYLYYTDSASGLTDYGSDVLYSGKTLSSIRYDAGNVTPFNLGVGQSYSQTFTVYETQYSPVDGTVTASYNYDESQTITFVGIQNVTVIGGTYTNCAHIQVQDSYTLPAAATGTTAQPHSDTLTLYASKYVGMVLSTNHSVIQNEQGTNTSNGQTFTYTLTDDVRDELVSATVGGVNYPPGKSVLAGTKVAPRRR